jgi:sulfoxide reductase heme-binding subunit YedZ
LKLSRSNLRALKVVLFALCALPAALLAWDAWSSSLGANPIDEITDATGHWTLRLLLVTLAMTPLRRLGFADAVKLRRMFGLWTFAYAGAHLLTYVWLDFFFLFGEMARDVATRPFIAMGLTAFIAMLPLAVTSSRGWIRRLKGRNWQRLHRLVYVAATAGVIHFWWLAATKADVREPVIYAGVLTLLLGYRAVTALRSRAANRSPGAAPDSTTESAVNPQRL